MFIGSISTNIPAIPLPVNIPQHQNTRRKQSHKRKQQCNAPKALSGFFCMYGRFACPGVIFGKPGTINHHETSRKVCSIKILACRRIFLAYRAHILNDLHGPCEGTIFAHYGKISYNKKTHDAGARMGSLLWDVRPFVGWGLFLLG